MRIAGMLALGLAGSVAGCNVRFGGSSGACGAEVKTTGADGSWINLDFANTTGDTIEIGGSQEASFVDGDGVAMQPQMTPSEDEWFMPFKLPAHSHRTVRVRVKGGTPSTLARIEVPHSGGDFIPDCTIKASF